MPKKLSRLRPEDFEHPQDAKALQHLKNTRGLDSAVRKFYELGIERLMKLQYTGSSLRLTQRNFPELIFLLEQACEVLGLREVPELYVQRSETFEAISLGVEEPIIVLTSESVDKLDPAELNFIIGREVGHILSEHILYREIGFIFPQLMDALASVTLGLSGLISAGLRYALYYWSQMSEYTADRAGLLACQEEEVGFRVLAKVAGLPEKHWDTFQMPDLYDQARAFEGLNQKNLDKLMGFLFENNQWGIARAKELREWVATGEYLDILKA